MVRWWFDVSPESEKTNSERERTGETSDGTATWFVSGQSGESEGMRNG